MPTEDTTVNITTRSLSESAKDFSYVSERLHETRANVSENINDALDISRGLRLVSWFLRNGHELDDAIKALNAAGLHSMLGQTWTVARLQAVVNESAAVVERVVADDEAEKAG